jgi:Zn-dependent protease with chaperone function
VVAWFTLGATTLLAALLGCATLVVPAVGDGLALLLHASLIQLRRDYDVSNGRSGVLLGVAAGAALLLRLGYCAVRLALETRRIRARQHASLRLLGAGLPTPEAPGLLVLPHSTPAAYCVPGRQPRVVITSATRDLLAADQLSGVLAHERAHLRGRHALLLGCVAAWHRAFGPLPVFAWGHREIGQLLEMRADDAATAVCDRVRLAEALVLLAEAGQRAAYPASPAAVLSATGPDALARVRRLAAPYRPLGTGYQALTLVALAVFALLPVAVSVAPAVAAAEVSSSSTVLTGR